MNDAEIRLRCLVLAKELFPSVSADAPAMVKRAEEFLKFVKPPSMVTWTESEPES